MSFYYVNERATAKYTAVIKDESEVAVGSSNIDAATLTLKTTGGTVVNSRDGQDILDTNGVTFSSTGLLTWTVASADNQMIGSGASERHKATFNITHNTSKRINHEIHIVVRQLAGITS